MDHYNPFDNLQLSGNNSSSNASSKKKRGLSRGSKPRPNGKKKKSGVNSWGQPIQAKLEANTYSSDIGFQECYDISHVAWFDLKEKIRDAWKRYKCHLNAILIVGNNPGDVKASPTTEFVPREDWVKFVDYCNSEKFLAKSKRNKENWAKLIASCTLDRTTIIKYALNGLAEERGVTDEEIGRVKLLYHRRIACLLNKQLHYRNMNRVTLKLTKVFTSNKLESFCASQENVIVFPSRVVAIENVFWLFSPHLAIVDEHLTRHLPKQWLTSLAIESDAEEAKIQENAKIQSALEEMQLQFKETKAMLAIKVVSLAKKLQPLVTIVEVLLFACRVAKWKKCQKFWMILIAGCLNGHRACSPKIYSSSMEMELSLANGHHDIEELKVNESHSVTPTNKLGPESENMSRRFHIERHHESVDALIKCVMQEIAFSQGKPVAAFTIYKCLLHWKSFKAERTSIFERLIQMIGSAIEVRVSYTNYMEVKNNVNGIEAPRTLRGSGLRTSGRSFGTNSPNGHWQGIIETLNKLIATLKQNFVPPVLVQKICTQIFSYINIQLFNSLLLRREYCTFSNGEYVKAGLAELELWCVQAKEEYAGSSWDELKHIRQAVGNEGSDGRLKVWLAWRGANRVRVYRGFVEESPCKDFEGLITGLSKIEQSVNTDFSVLVEVKLGDESCDSCSKLRIELFGRLWYHRKGLSVRLVGKRRHNRMRGRLGNSKVARSNMWNIFSTTFPKSLSSGTTPRVSGGAVGGVRRVFCRVNPEVDRASQGNNTGGAFNTDVNWGYLE
ncbi:hypothetical protein GIB67_034994, partial [Kingdonia uniflora]